MSSGRGEPLELCDIVREERHNDRTFRKRPDGFGDNRPELGLGVLRLVGGRGIGGEVKQGAEGRTHLSPSGP